MSSAGPDVTREDAEVDVTVVMPTYNAEAHLREQLDALARQDTDCAWELVISDNGSRDATLDVVREYADGFPVPLRVVDAGAQSGAAYARNRGAWAARGPLVVFCDADDVADSLWLHEMVRALRDAEIVAGRLDSESLNSEEVRRWRGPAQDADLPRFLGVPYVISANMGATKATFERLGGFDESFGTAAGEDVDFGVRAVASGIPIAFAPRAQIAYRHRSTLAESLAQARMYGRVGSSLIARHRDGPITVPTLGDDAKMYYRLAKRALKSRVLQGRVAGDVRWDATYHWAQARMLRRTRAYWTWRQAHSDETSAATVQRQRLRKVARRVVQRVAAGEGQPPALLSAMNPWEAADALAAMPAEDRHMLGAGLLADADVTIACERDGLTYYLNPSLDGIVAELINEGSYSADELEHVGRHLAEQRHNGAHPGTVVNVGANIGTTALHFARAGYRVVAVEPARRTVELLEKNVATNGFEGSVTVVQAAVTAHAQPVELVVGDNLSTSQLRGENDPAALGTRGDHGLHVEEVEGRPLQDILDSLSVQDVRLVWSDTEGAEAGVITGGLELWRAGVPLWLEVRPAALRDHAPIAAFVAAAKASFTRFRTLEDLANGAPGRPIGELRDFIDEVGHGRWDFANVLLSS
jgi:FkbM family methyltransferase